MEVNIGGERLGSGNKLNVDFKNYERSTHDLSYAWRSTMSSGTLVPFMSEVALPGDTFDIDLEATVMTHPTIGPLFGSYKVQLDIFMCPVRLYNGKLHMNLLNIGLKMQEVALPQIRIAAKNKGIGDLYQINPSSIHSYFNVKGLGINPDLEPDEKVTRKFNAIPYLAYWYIYKNYYSAKMEEVGAVIHNSMNNVEITNFILQNGGPSNIQLTQTSNPQGYNLGINGTAFIDFATNDEPNPDTIYLYWSFSNGGAVNTVALSDVFSEFEWNPITSNLTCSGINPASIYTTTLYYNNYTFDPNTQETVKIETVPLENIDIMRKDILKAVDESEFLINAESLAPYGLCLGLGDNGYSATSTQEGLGLKTYQSDLFNNWINTEWIDGDNGINAITAIDTSEGSFTVDTLMLSRKVYDMLNRIAMSGGTYDDWLNASYTHERTRGVENPVYMGGLSKELAFQEVISNAAATVENEKQPLGTLAGRGVMTDKKKGGKVRVKANEPCYIIGIVSLTPRTDYSQGIKYDMNLKTMDDFHKPAMDEIGFQDLLVEQMHWKTTTINNDGTLTRMSAGKQPAWINYMTNVNRCYGNFADENQQMFMTLNRRYEVGIGGIKDLTTYVDPSKFNNIFADTRLDAQNFWTQIGVGIQARRKMSAKLMPNL